MEFPKQLLYTKEHVWVELANGQVRVGITDFAQSQLNDVVFVELPQVGDAVKAAEKFAIVESVKSVSDIYGPFDGKVVEVNSKLADAPELINQDPYGEGWIAMLEAASPIRREDLLNAEDYEAVVAD